jgi:hypothetical protein
MSFCKAKTHGIQFSRHPLAAFCLIAATFTIEQYCKRRLFLKKYFERIEVSGDSALGS